MRICRVWAVVMVGAAALQSPPTPQHDLRTPGMPPSNLYDSEIMGSVSTEMNNSPSANQLMLEHSKLLLSRKDDSTPKAPVEADDDVTEVSLPAGVDLRDIFDPDVLMRRNAAHLSTLLDLRGNKATATAAPPHAVEPSEVAMRLPVVDLVPRIRQIPPHLLETADMRSTSDTSFDDDCDSPQTGELDVQVSVKETMNAKPKLHLMGAEQSNNTREVLSDVKSFVKPVKDHPAAFKGSIESHSSHFEKPLEVHDSSLVRNLPDAPKGKTSGKSKCSRNTNGHDLIDPLDELDDDCGMPEPIIPCETAGNSTRCPPKLILEPPRVPEAEVMPTLPLPPTEEQTVAVEWVDFGTSKQPTVGPSSTIEDVVVAGGREVGVEAWHVQLVRNAGADVPITRPIHQLEDKTSIVVYLSCTPRRFQKYLIVRLPACEDVGVITMQARVEVPETDDVFSVSTKSDSQVDDVIHAAGVHPYTTSKVTYNGARVRLNATLADIHFANRSALVVYLNGKLMPTHASLSKPPSQITRKDSLNATVPKSVTGDNHVGRPLRDSVQVPKIEHSSFPRPVMTKAAKVFLRIVTPLQTSVDGKPRDIPVQIHPDHRGDVLFTALSDLGISSQKTSLTFNKEPIGQTTELKSFGFLDDDIIIVKVMK